MCYEKQNRYRLGKMTPHKVNTAHWGKGQLIAFAIRRENMSHRTMGFLSQGEQWASGRSWSVLDGSKKVLHWCGFILEWVLCRKEESLVKDHLSCHQEEQSIDEDIEVSYVLWYLVQLRATGKMKYFCYGFNSQSGEEFTLWLKTPYASDIGFGWSNI